MGVGSLPKALYQQTHEWPSGTRWATISAPVTQLQTQIQVKEYAGRGVCMFSRRRQPSCSLVSNFPRSPGCLAGYGVTTESSTDSSDTGRTGSVTGQAVLQASAGTAPGFPLHLSTATQQTRCAPTPTHDVLHISIISLQIRCNLCCRHVQRHRHMVIACNPVYSVATCYLDASAAACPHGAYSHSACSATSGTTSWTQGMRSNRTWRTSTW